MKKTAAILGETPAFIAWSIRQDCTLKMDVAENQPLQVERFLRGLRLAGEASSDGRFIDDWVYQIPESESEPVRIFSLGEIAAAFGGWDRVQQTCRACPANVVAPTAGCYGWLSIEDMASGSLNSLNSQITANEWDLLQEIGVRRTQPAWFGLWIPTELRGTVCEVYRSILLRRANLAADPSRIWQLVDALGVCSAKHLVLDVLSLPAGFSDGLHWTLQTHCPECIFPLDTNPADWHKRRCPCCAGWVSPRPARRRKVRGHRPFVDIFHRLAHAEAEQLRRRILDKANHID